MARRIFIVELDDRIKGDGQLSWMKPVDPVRLTRDAGYIQGLTEAKRLYEEITKANLMEDDKS